MRHLCGALDECWILQGLFVDWVLVWGEWSKDKWFTHEWMALPTGTICSCGSVGRDGCMMAVKRQLLMKGAWWQMVGLVRILGYFDYQFRLPLIYHEKLVLSCTAFVATLLSNVGLWTEVFVALLGVASLASPYPMQHLSLMRWTYSHQFSHVFMCDVLCSG